MKTAFKKGKSPPLKIHKNKESIRYPTFLCLLNNTKLDSKVLFITKIII